MLLAAGASREPRVLRRPFAEVRATLAGLGDAISSRLESLHDERAQLALKAWTARGDADAVRIAAAASHLTRETILRVAAGQDTAHMWELGVDQNEPGPLLVAARMLNARVPDAVIERIVSWIRAESPRATSVLDSLAQEAEEQQPAGKPHAQGRAVAVWFRSIPGCSDESGRVDPERVLTDLGVRIAEEDLTVRGIDAVACWGYGHGPAILVNRSGKHAQGQAGRRSTLAHELGHLLLDRRRALPVAEVLGGAAPPEAEQRANGFLAELLLPIEVAGRALSKTRDASATVRELSDRYGASKLIVAWQAIRSGWTMSVSTRTYLRSLLPVREHAKFDNAYDPH